MSDLDPDIAADWGQSAAPPAAPSGMNLDPDIAADWSHDKAADGPKTYSGGIGGTPLDAVMEHELKSMYATGASGVHTIHDFLSGKLHSFSEATKQRDIEIAKNAPPPLEKGSTAETLEQGIESGANPLNWPSWALKEGGKLVQKVAELPSGAGRVQTTGGRGALYQGIPSQYTTILGAGAEAGASTIWTPSAVADRRCIRARRDREYCDTAPENADPNGRRYNWR